MVTIKLKFLLAFSPKAKEKSKKEKKIKEEKDKPGAKKKINAEVQDPPYLIRLEKTFSVAHIEYELIPGKCKYQVDVLCWSNAAKIYTFDGVKIFKTVTKNGLTFVPICVVHQLKEISTDDLISLQSSIIEFNVFTDKTKLGNMAKANRTEMVYLREFDCGRTDFVEAHTERVDISVMSTKKSIKTVRTDMDDTLSHHTGYQKNEAYSQMVFEVNFAEKLYEIINVTTSEGVQEDLPQFRDFVKPPNLNEEQVKKPGSKKAAADKNAKKEGKKQKADKSSTKLTLQMQGEIFFTDPNLAIFRVENHKCEVSRFFVLLQVENLLTRAQKIHLNPIVIKTKYISGFPEKVFENSGFTDVYCKYSIPCIAESKSIEKPISKFMKFNESHIFFTHTLSKIKLLEFLESKRLIVEFYGVKKYPPKETDPKLYGEKKSDANISKINSSFQQTCLKKEEYLKSPDELLAYCSFDLSSLLRNSWDFREKAQLHNMERSTFAKHSNQTSPVDINDMDLDCDLWGTYNMSTNTINLAHIDKSFSGGSTSLLKEWNLLKNATTLSLEAYLLSPQAAALVLHQIPNTYKRLFLIAFERNVVTECFGKILRHNLKIICDKLSTDNSLTGFVLDNGNNIAIYAEGLAIGYILNIWQELENYAVELVKVFFNTDQAYEKRLYPICNKWSGFFIITLKAPLEDILKDQRVYVKGNAPILCLKALTKLDLLFHTRTLKLMLQYDLFPTIEELASLDLEYGVPYAWKEPVLAETLSITDSEIIDIENF